MSRTRAVRARVAAASTLGGLLLAGLASGAGAQAPASVGPGAAVPAAPRSSAAAAPRSSKLLFVRSDGVRFFGGAPPPGWQEPTFDDSAWRGPVPGPFAPRAVVAPGSSAQAVDVPRGGALCLRRHFDVDEVARAHVVELRIGYADGFIAWLNGREIARRSIPEGAGEDDEPQQSHGGEIERLYVPATPGSLAARGNVLAVQIRPRAPGPKGGPPPRGAPAGSADVAVSSGIRIVRGPYLVAPDDQGVSVAWETDVPARGRIDFPGDARRAPITVDIGRRHVVRLEGGGALTYRVTALGGTPSDEDVAGPFTHAPLPRPGEPFTFAVYGDMRAPGHEAHALVVGGLVREAPALVVNTGDLVNRGTEESDWQRYFDITARLGAVSSIVPALGNHDAFRGDGARRTWELFALRAAGEGSQPGWTSFDAAGVHFIILDSNQWRDEAQKKWLADDLAAAARRRPRAVFAFCHDGPWTHGFHGGNRIAARDYAPLLQAARVDLLFSGHDHLYERGQVGGLPYVVSGGGGAPIYNPTCQPVGQAPFSDVPSPLPVCPPGVVVLKKAYHYVMVTVGAEAVSVCPKLPDGRALEACVRYPLKKR